jgi:ATP-dependent DNA helicase RecG
MNLPELQTIVAAGEGRRLELKRSTGELRRGLQTACAFLNGEGGHVVFGVAPDGTIVGQDVSDQTLRDIAQEMEAFEPPARFETRRVELPSRREVLVLDVNGRSDAMPFTFEGRAYERVSSTTRQMPKERYEQLLLDRMHSTHRWENQEAEHTTLADIDRDEVQRVVAMAREAHRLSEPLGRDVERALDRLGVRRDGRMLRAAVVLFGTRFLPDFPQCSLRLARFRGTDKSEFIDQKWLHGPAVRLLDQAQLFADQHLPVAARVVPEQVRRLETPLIPPDALREIMVNALIHRDYTIAGGAVSLAIFDDRVEVWSAGQLPAGVTPEMLTRDHNSVPRNPIIAETFHRAGLIEMWGRGTNRVVEMCRDHGIASPEFQQVGPWVVVTFRVKVGTTRVATPHETPHETPQVTPQVAAVLDAARTPRSRTELLAAAGLGDREYFRTRYLEVLLRAGWIERTIPEKPRSKLQRYRTTEAGLAALHRTDST